MRAAPRAVPPARPRPSLLFAAAAALGSAALVCAALVCAACTSSNAGHGAPSIDERARDDRILEALRVFEQERRAAADLRRAPPSDRLFGPDPYAIRAVGERRFAGLLRGADAIVLLDDQLRELARADAPASPSGLAVDGDTVFVVGERASEVRTYRVSESGLAARASIPLPGVRALRAIAAGPAGVLHVVEEAGGRLITLVPDPRAPAGYDLSTIVAAAGAFRVARTPSAVVVASLIAHTVAAYPVDAQGRPVPTPAVISSDGPLWSFAATEDGDALLVASGGVEDKPLDRTHGSFENIDSFVYLDRIALRPAPRVTRIAAINVSEHGVLVPKALDLALEPEGIRILTTGYGGDAMATVFVPKGDPAPRVTTGPLPPGTAAFLRDERGDLVIANPLLDAWIRSPAAGRAPAIVKVPDPAASGRTAASRLGEALIFTRLIAPWNSSEGPLSRFTCETCHFEGYIDGRTHATGRGAVRATTRPLLGLFNNRPHFSRALDPDLSTVAHSEFRVAGARSGHDPVFDLRLSDAPWLEHLGVTPADLDALSLRRALMSFLMDWSHRASAMTAGQRVFTPDERRGAALFRDRCEGCHEARLSSDVPGSREPFDSWEGLIFADAAPIVWGQARYAKTGPSPYVHDEGARIPPLRRLYKKGPYFTTGAAKTLADVLARARFAEGPPPPEGPFFHDASPADPALRALAPDERAALLAFLLLL